MGWGAGGGRSASSETLFIAERGECCSSWVRGSREQRCHDKSEKWSAIQCNPDVSRTESIAWLLERMEQRTFQEMVVQTFLLPSIPSRSATVLMPCKKYAQ